MYYAPLYVVKIRFVYEYMFRVVFCLNLVYNGNTTYVVIFKKGGSMKMPRPFVFPDPNDRSKNNPAVIVTSEQVIGLYNQYNKNGDEVQRVSGNVKEWFFQKQKTIKDGMKQNLLEVNVS